MRTLGREFSFLMLPLIAASCQSGKPLPMSDGGADSAVGGDAGPGPDAGGEGADGASADAGSVYGGGCPPTPPASGAACPRESLVCEYGDDPRLKCHTQAECSPSRTWNVIPPTCDPIPPATCPATRDQANGQSCTTKDAVCAYDGLACTCTNCADYPIPFCDGPLQWKCDAPSPDPGCPHAPGVLGTTCSPEGLTCRYRCDLGRACTGGIWVESQVGAGCPISLRGAKRDIRYVTGPDRARLAADLARIRLATYHYRDPANGEGVRLGFIIDDSPDIAAVDAGHGRVDLYAYASMAVAALQEQARQIAELRREVARLKRKAR
jgi:hypothetical protein